MNAPERPRPAPPSPLSALASLLRTLRLILHEAPGLVSDRVRLLALELKRARQALALIVGLLAAAAVLMFTGWLALWFGLAAIAIEHGLALHWAVLVVVLLNLGVAALVVQRALALIPLLALPATVRHLTVNAAPDGDAARAEEQP